MTLVMPRRGKAIAASCAVASCLLLSACAGPIANRRDAVRLESAKEARRVWDDLVVGQDDQVATRLARVPREDDGELPRDLATWLAEASLAFERGAGERAVAAYLALLENADASASPGASAMAAMAAGRLGTLLDEHPGPESARRAVEDRILRASFARLSWEARFALAMLSDRIGRRRGDPDLLSGSARRFGCVSQFKLGAPVGRLPHLDLDQPAPTEPKQPLRAVRSTGCRIAVPSFEERAGVQRMFATVDVPSDGAYQVVVDFRGEGRVIIDGGKPTPHGSEDVFGPRTTAHRVALGPGRHAIELRLGTYGGHPELTLMVVPAPAIEAPPRTPPPASASAAIAQAYVANQLGDLPRSEAAATVLEASPKFAVGLALLAALTRDNPSLPAAFARDRARGLLRRAVAVDAQLARGRNALAGLALEDDRPQEALDEARTAAKQAPGWWLPAFTLYGALRLRGLEWDADRALDQAIADAPGACSIIEAALQRAQTRRQWVTARRLEDQSIVCGVVTDERVERLRRRGDLDGAEALLRLSLRIEPDRDEGRRDLARLLVARGRTEEAVTLLEPNVELARYDGEATLEWVNALVARGEGARARSRLESLLIERPDLPQILRAARALALPLPLDGYRLDGRKVIRDFEASKRVYAAPAVVILDRSVTRVLPTGAELTLTHEIVRVQSKDAITKWGEVSIPPGAEILTLRTHKPDGTTREPEEVAGKDAISAADLAIGDYLEKETLEVKAPSEAFGKRGADAPAGYLGERFYFQSFDAPLDRSEYLLVTTPELATAIGIDARAGAPQPTRASSGKGAEVVTTFAAHQVPQLFAERASIPTIEYVPSVRVSVGARWSDWSRFVREQMYGTLRQAAALQPALTEIRAQATGTTPRALAAALVTWVGENVEQGDDLRGLATFAVVSGRGNRVATILALGRLLGLAPRLVLGRSRFVAEPGAPTPVEESDDFSEVLVSFDLPGGKAVVVDPRLKHAPLGYLSPGLDGGRGLMLDTGAFQIIRGTADDAREVDLSLRLSEDGAATGRAVERLRGWPALEWAEIVDRVGGDDTKMRQDFEQRWLGVHFPGARLSELSVEILGPDGTPRPSPAGGASRPRPYAVGEVRVRYAFASPRLGVAEGGRLRVSPTFFRAQPGRRYAVEPRRATSMMTSFDVPTTLTARLELPRGAQLVQPPGAGPTLARGAPYLYTEERRVGESPSGALVVTLRRVARLPLMRVSPEAYATFAQDLRRVDASEREDLTVVLGARVSGTSP